MLAISRAIVEPRKLAADRRADQGPRARHHRQPDRGLRRAEEDRHHHPDGGAELPCREIAGRLGGGDGRRAHRACRAHGRPGGGRGAADEAARAVFGSAPVKAIEAQRFDWIPPALMLAIVLGALALIGSPSTWVTLTVAGLAMGLMIFIMASGLTLVFGLMDVMNFAHGLFIAVGAYVAASTVKLFAGAAGADSFLANLGAIVPAMLAAALVAGLLGLVFRARHHQAGLRPAPQADPHHHRRPDRRRAADPRVLGTGPAADRAARDAARLLPLRRRRDREVTGCSRWSSASRCSPPCCCCSTAPRSAC